MSLLFTICALHFVAQLSPGPDVLLIAKSSASTTQKNTFMKNKIEDLKSTIQELIELFEEQNLEHWAEMYKRILFYIDDRGGSGNLNNTYK